MDCLRDTYRERTQKELPAYGLDEKLLSGWVISSKDREAGTIKVPQMSYRIPDRTALEGQTT